MTDVRERETIRVPASGPVAKLYAIEIAGMTVHGAFTWAGAHRWLADRPELATLAPTVVPA